jgi:hypothetical protein
MKVCKNLHIALHLADVLDDEKKGPSTNALSEGFSGFYVTASVLLTFQINFEELSSMLPAHNVKVCICVDFRYILVKPLIYDEGSFNDLSIQDVIF